MGRYHQVAPGNSSSTGPSGKGSSVILNMSQISVRSVHLLRWLLIMCALVAVVFWFWHRWNLQLWQASDVQVPSLQNVGPEFVLGRERKKLRILSGSLHYFRVVPEYWEDRLIKMKACGLNTVTTYVPWNMHEQVRGDFDFTGRLDIVAFLNLAKKVGLYVILRPGPYICSEWDLGGLPSWLLSYDEMKLRTMYPLFIDAVDKYFDRLFPLMEHLQYYRGGPIIALQVENEYGSYGSSKEYMNYIKEAMEKRNLKEMFLTSDSSKASMEKGHLPGVLVTANFQIGPERHFQDIKDIQGPDKPLMVMEFWTAWFDYWGGKHHIFSAGGIADRVKSILDLDASINFYMFHGGTNFGFMNGANIEVDVEREYAPDVTSYDFDAPLSEAGDLTEKYYKIKEVLKANTPSGTVPDKLPSIPTQRGKMAYGDVQVTHYMTLEDSATFVGEPIKMDNPVAMEKLPVNQDGGQGYGFLLYRTTIDHRPETLKLDHPPHDRAQVFLNSKQVGVMARISPSKDTTLKFSGGENGPNTLELFVENMGRVNYGYSLDHERKGILGSVQIDGKPQLKWDMLPFEFKKPFLEAVSSSSTKWKEYKAVEGQRPALYKAVLEIKDSQPKDTFVDMTGWEKGVIFVNNFNLGRYWNIGPTSTYYLPGPLLKQGTNEIIIFELHRSSNKFKLTDTHSLGDTVHVKNDEDV